MGEHGGVALRERVEPLLGLVAEHADWTHQHRRPAPAVIAGLADAGLLRVMAPVEYGGEGAHSEDFVGLVEAIATADGSAAWTAMTLNEEMGIASAYLEPATMQSLLAQDPTTVVAGSGLTSGRATRVQDGWKVSGRWRFVTGGIAADHLILGTVVEDSSPPELCYVLVPRSDAEILDTWDVLGLRGTASNDVVLDGLFVADDMAACHRLPLEPKPNTPFYCLPSGLRFPFPKVGVAAGIARAAIDAFTELAGSKQPTTSRSLLRERPSAQAAVAEAEALVRSGRAYVSAELAELWDVAERGRPIDAALHARCRLACAHSVQNSIRAVEAVHSAAGTSVNFVDSPFAIQLLDARAVAQHFMVAPYQADTAGRMLLGLEPGDPAF